LCRIIRDVDIQGSGFLENKEERVGVFDEAVAGAWDDVWVRTLNSRQYFARVLENNQLFN
jgi:hypothetical protein